MAGDDDVVSMRVDVEACMGIGQCEMLEPEVFEIDDDDIAGVAAGARLTRTRADEVVARCPSQAISVVDDGS